MKQQNEWIAVSEDWAAESHGKRQLLCTLNGSTAALAKVNAPLFRRRVAVGVLSQ